MNKNIRLNTNSLNNFPKVHISKMTGKLQGLQAISTNTTTNKFCNKMNKSNNIDV